MGAVAGGIGGHWLGKKADHGIIGTLAGAFLGSKMEDMMKERKHSNQGYGGGYGRREMDDGLQYGDNSSYNSGNSGEHHHHHKHHHENNY